jgi:hypothetical protein
MNQSLIPEPVRNRFNQGYKNLKVNGSPKCLKLNGKSKLNSLKASSRRSV